MPRGSRSSKDETKNDSADQNSGASSTPEPPVPSGDTATDILIKPEVGRVVLFNDGFSDQLCAAKICYVHSDSMINIGYLDANGLPQSKTSVLLIQDPDVMCLVGSCRWMDYQIKNK